MALIGISSIHLLTTFVYLASRDGADQITTHQVLWQVLIHLTFVASALVLAFIDRLSWNAPLAAKH